MYTPARDDELTTIVGYLNQQLDGLRRGARLHPGTGSIGAGVGVATSI